MDFAQHAWCNDVQRGDRSSRTLPPPPEDMCVRSCLSLQSFVEAQPGIGASGYLLLVPEWPCDRVRRPDVPLRYGIMHGAAAAVLSSKPALPGACAA